MNSRLLPYRHKSKIWDRLVLEPLPKKWNGAIIYLDRDGVLNRGSENYVNSVNELEILPNVAESLSILRNNGFRLCLVTNQSPINRGLWSHKVLEDIHEKLINELQNESEDAILDLILYSPYKPDENSISRKPNPGMLMAGNYIINMAERNYKDSKLIIDDLSECELFDENPLSSMVGDRIVDYEAGKLHGVRTFLVDPNIGLPDVIDRLLDNNDKGDVLE
ncbi:MAG: hypothetical protein CMB56_007080 [Methanobacteriota archaeon]|nr:MAG: hypothetical protein CMB56_007080 [Euryarchaeota archaeon]|tara:strand:+ start:17064 stop:17726 length:663 start_codon:yes stop_codon:yes gene_type:complete